MDKKQLRKTYKEIALQVGDFLKNSTTINEINRAAQSTFDFQRIDFPLESVTSSRARLIYDWIMSLASQCMTEEVRKVQLLKFLELIALDENKDEMLRIVENAGLKTDLHIKKRKNFLERCFHREINKNCLKLYLDEHYFHAVFEAAKIYNILVKEKSNSSKDGQALMMDVWNPEKGVLKITPCKSETDKNVQDGIAFLAAGLMRAIRNPTSHEPAHLWPIDEQECLDILSFISFLLKKLDKAIYCDLGK